jgi:predicted MPP superfamily phosphohydrolase
MKHTDEFVLASLAERLGSQGAQQRLALEIDHWAEIIGQRLSLFRAAQLWSRKSLIETIVKSSGLYPRGLRNAACLRLRRNELFFDDLPAPFDGLTILHISDLHVELSAGAMQTMREQLLDIDYDICVLTGDFRAGYGPFQSTLEGVAKVRDFLKGPVYGVLGNHDTVRMVPGLEAMRIRMLLNESVPIVRDGHTLFLAGIDDAHSHRAHDIDLAVSQIPERAFSILLSHTPEIYQQAAHAGFRLLLSGHTHGGQICLPGGIPITLDADLPRRMAAGAWRFEEMHGYTSAGAGTCIVPVRFNCPPEITLHILRSSARASMVRREDRSNKIVGKEQSLQPQNTPE